MKESQYISEIVLLGDSTSGIVAIVVPNFDRVRHWAREEELDSRDLPALIQRSETKAVFKKELDRLSSQLADFERIKRFTLIDHTFTIEGGELTPTLKVKRRVIAEKYADVLQQMSR